MFINAHQKYGEYHVQLSMSNYQFIFSPFNCSLLIPHCSLTSNPFYIRQKAMSN